MRIVFLLLAAFALRVTTASIEANFSVHQNSTLETWMAERTAMPLRVTETGSMISGGIKQSRDSCFPGWYPYGSRCFKFFSSPKTWIDAENYCLYFGANLASIHNPGEYEFITELASKNSFPSFWIGGSDAVKSLKWLWSDGSIVYYNNWASGEPNESKGLENCIEMLPQGWNDRSCGISSPFICATRPDRPI
ncbi:ladderlectin-like [Thunnus albacares]|uniref:ladderlectin-like n=1 Tax=Thunnus albacares TaxID=8236 RepID=UPI001CF624A0|nr:ladderlectin-like [Thunnus albacares]